MKSTQVAVYGRLKPCPESLQNQEFYLKNGEIEDQIIIPPYNKNSPKRKRFRFKKIFDVNVTQEQIFNIVAKPVINNVLSGYNGMIFTYGQTGSGKTYTMTGHVEESKRYGLIPRTIQKIFQAKKNSVIKITYCEIYNERVYDLIGNIDFEPDGTRVSQLKNLKITMFRDLSVHEVEKAADALQLFFKGNEKKTVGETEYGSFTSRSHVIFSIRLEFPCTENGMLRFNPILHLIDLASAENREGSSGNPLETRNINLSLLYLEHAMLGLRRPRKILVPYKNSRIVAFLKSTLGGNFVTAAIATLSSGVNDIEQTVQTCQFAERLGHVTSIAYPNEVIVPSKKIFNPFKDIEFLEKQYKFLKAHLNIFLNNQLPDEELNEDEKAKCAALVQQFIAGSDIVDFLDCDVRKTIYCFQLMREEILKKETLTDTPVKLELSDISLESFNELPLDTSKEISNNAIVEKSPERTSFTELIKASEEWEWAQGRPKFVD